MADEGGSQKEPTTTPDDKKAAESSGLLKEYQDKYDLLEAQNKIDKQLATQQSDIIKSQKETLSSIISKGETKGLEGAITTSGDLEYIAEHIAYMGLETNAVSICNAISKKITKTNEGNRILIVDKMGLAMDDLPYVEVMSQFEFYNELISRQTGILDGLIARKKPSSGVSHPAFAEITLLALAMAPTVISTIADIAGYFKSDFTITGLKFSVQNESTISAIAGKLAGEGTKVYILNNYLLRIDPKTMTDTETLFGKLYDCNRKAILISQRKTKLTELIREEMAKPAGKDQEWLDTAGQATQDSDNVIAMLNLFLKTITTADNGQQYSRFSLAVLRDQIRKLKITHILYLTIASSGGETISQKSVLGKAKFSYLSGLTINWVLTDSSDGAVVDSDVFSGFYRYNCSPEGGIGEFQAILPKETM